MSALFEKLYSLLQDELKRQESVLAICRGQGEAVRQRDLELLEAKTAALTRLMQQVGQAAAERLRVMNAIAAEYGLDPNGLTLQTVLAAAPRELRDRLEIVQHSLRQVLKQTRPVVQANAFTMRNALRTTNASLSILRPAAAAVGATSYNAAGMSAVRASAAPNWLIDRRG